MGKKRWLLPLIVAMVLVPLVIALLVSGYGIYTQKETMKETAQDFARALAQDLADALASGPHTSFSRGSGNVSRRTGQNAASLKMLQSGPPVHGWVAVFTSSGHLKYGSGGSRNLPEIEQAVKEAIRQQAAQDATVKIGRNPESALSVVPCPDGRQAAVAVISHYLMPPKMRFAIDAVSYYKYAAVVELCIAVLGVVLLLKYCISPLRSLAASIAAFKWGRETFSVKSFGALPEIAKLQSTLSELSKRAVEREKLQKEYVNVRFEAQEEEQHSIEREIHDTAVQTITSGLWKIQRISRLLSKEDIVLPDKIMNCLKEAEKADETAIKELRGICSNLVPTCIKMGAEGALEELASQLSKLHQIDVAASVDGDAGSLTEKQVLQLYRIVQEAASNAVKHGNATRIDAELICSDKAYVLKVLDNGSGIGKDLNPEKLYLEKHRGLANMKERAAVLGGHFAIANGEGGGTLVTVVIPNSKGENLDKTETA